METIVPDNFWSGNEFEAPASGASLTLGAPKPMMQEAPSGPRAVVPAGAGAGPGRA